MKHLKTTLLILLPIILNCKSNNPVGPGSNPNTKVFLQEWQPWTVTENGVPLDVPYLGGLNDPKISLVDFNGDNLPDLFIWQVYDIYNGGLIYFENTGTVFSPEWTPVVDPFEGINVGSWYTFCDIDADGDLDLFCDSRTNHMYFYENTSGSHGGFPKPNAGGGSRNLFTLVDTAFGGFLIGYNNTPSFVDIDNDGDFDYFYGIISGRLEYYENTGDSANPDFVYVTSVYDSVCATCPDTIVQPVPTKPSVAQHGFSCIDFADIDNDKDMDLFWGDINNTNIYFFRNDGDPVTSDINLVTKGYLPTSTSGFNHVQTADLDGDGDLDMLVSVGQLSSTNNLIYYRNDGTPQSPSFTEITRNLITEIDIGRQSVPAFADIDNDNDIDMLVGSANGQIAYYQNTGTVDNPSFELVTMNFGNIDVGTYSAPALVDWDGDNDLDLLIGNANGRIEFWRNDGDASNFVPTLVTNQLASIQVDQQAVPCPVDLNDDGLIDLLVGEYDFNIYANVLLYENVDTLKAPNPALALVTNRLTKREFRDFTMPVVYDWNEDGKKDLIIGGEFLGMELYINSADSGQFPDSLTLTKSTEKLPGFDSGETLYINFIDIDNDGDDDIFLGEKGGGIDFFRRLQ